MMNEVSDVCELVPELYYMPEVLLNLNSLKLGKLNGVEIGDIILPDWCCDSFDLIRYNIKQIPQESSGE